MKTTEQKRKEAEDRKAERKALFEKLGMRENAHTPIQNLRNMAAKQ